MNFIILSSLVFFVNIGDSNQPTECIPHLQVEKQYSACLETTRDYRFCRFLFKTQEEFRCCDRANHKSKKLLKK